MSNIHRFPDRGRAPPPRGAISVSPRFIPFVAAFVASGAALYTGIASGGLPVFVFVMSGWIVSLCLHEFGHAYAALLGGDDGVQGRGYLSLDPLSYSQPMLSIVLPVLFLAMGGIALPGGAIYVDRSKLRSRTWDSLVALAGPAMTFAFFLVLAAPFAFGAYERQSGALDNHFWAGLAMLAYLQAMALVFNLLPLPGFDGFGALAAFMSPKTEAKLMHYAQPVLLIVILAILIYPPALTPVHIATLWLTDLFGVDVQPLAMGLRLFRFWS